MVNLSLAGARGRHRARQWRRALMAHLLSHIVSGRPAICVERTVHEGRRESDGCVPTTNRIQFRWTPKHFSVARQDCAPPRERPRVRHDRNDTADGLFVDPDPAGRSASRPTPCDDLFTDWMAGAEYETTSTEPCDSGISLLYCVLRCSTLGFALRTTERRIMTKSTLFTRPFLLLVVGHFLQALGWSSMLLLPIYVDHLGASQTEIGWIMVMASVGGLLFRPVVGWALDRVGRKPTLLVGTMILALGMFCLGWVDSIGPAVYFARFLVGVGAGTLFTGYFAYVSDFIPAERRTEGLALFGVSGLLPVAFNAVIHRLDIPASDLNLLYPMLSGLVLLSMLALIPVPETAAKGTRADNGGGWTQIRTALLQRNLRPTWGATVVFATLVAVFMTYATISAQHRGIQTPADLWAFYAAGAIGVRLLGARLPDRVGPSNLVVPALCIYAAAFIVMAGATTRFEVCTGGLMAGLGHGYCFPVLTGQVVTRMPDSLTGTGLAAFTALWELSSLCLTPLYGLVSDSFGSPVMFSLGAVISVTAAGAWALAEHRMAGEPRV